MTSTNPRKTDSALEADARRTRISSDECAIPAGVCRAAGEMPEDKYFGEIAKHASQAAVARTLAAGRPVTFWKDGRLYHQFPNGTEIPVAPDEIAEVTGMAGP